MSTETATLSLNPKRKSEEQFDEKLSKRKKQKIERPGFGNEKYEETSYYFENGLRKVYPYNFTYTSYCKGRWIGKPLIDIFIKEFRAHPKEQYEKSIISGGLTVNGQPVKADYVLKDNDLIANKVHRHEIPVLASPIQIIHQCDKLVVINKPPSIPVHPCGRYRHNTLAFILAKEHGIKDLNVLHRLDRLTSGILMFGCELNKTRDIEEQIRNRTVIKKYLCRVVGNFPDVISCKEPISSLSFKIGVCYVEPNGKPCQTNFEKLSYNGNTSVVLCTPITGRMHQIRVHLQYLGYPIVNDPIYNHQVFGPHKGKEGNFGKTNEQLVEDLIKLHTAENWLGIEGDTLPTKHSKSADLIAQKALEAYTKLKEYDELEKKYSLDAIKIQSDSSCLECKQQYKDPKPSDLVMFLHAWKYKGEGFEFETPLPPWAQADWQD